MERFCNESFVVLDSYMNLVLMGKVRCLPKATLDEGNFKLTLLTTFAKSSIVMFERVLLN